MLQFGHKAIRSIAGFIGGRLFYRRMHLATQKFTEGADEHSAHIEGGVDFNDTCFVCRVSIQNGLGGGLFNA